MAVLREQPVYVNLRVFRYATITGAYAMWSGIESNNSKKSLTRKVNNMGDNRIFREGEIVIIHDGSEHRSGIELAEVAQYASYIDQKVLIRYGTL
jgi:hypothetical protein